MNKNDAQNSRRAKAKAEGKCRTCGVKPTPVGYATCDSCRATTKNYYQRHKDKMKAYYQRNRQKIIERTKQYDEAHPSERRKRLNKRRRQKRMKAIKLLGERCRGVTSAGCRWVNEDGTYGCTDVRILQIDHAKGGGADELKHGRKAFIGSDGVVIKILRGETNTYQLLCPNCNWLKRVLGTA
jgi:transposase